MKTFGTLLAICGLFSVSWPLMAQETDVTAAPINHASETPASDPDPFASPRDVGSRLAIPAVRAGLKRGALRLRLETWEGTAQEVARWQDTAKGGVALEQLRQDFLSGKTPARLVFSPSIGIDQATASVAESLTELIYPTEYEPPVHPAAAAKEEEAAQGKDNEWKNWLEAAGDHAVPSSFETRNTGNSLAATVQAVTAEEDCWDVSLSFEDVAFLGTISHGAQELLIEMPQFGSFRTGGLVRLKEGKWRLLSVMEPPRSLDGKPSDKRWLTLVRIDPEE